MRSIRAGFPSPENSAVLIVVFPWSITRCMTAIFACKDTKTPLIIRRLPQDLFFFACPDAACCEIRLEKTFPFQKLCVRLWKLSRLKE